MVHSPARVPLDSPEWAALETRMGAGAESVADTLRRLLDDASPVALFTEMWPTLCSEGTTYNAAFAAAPYLVELARRVVPQDAVEYLVVLGPVETYAGTVPHTLEPAYREALRDAQALAFELLSDCSTDHNIRYLLGAVAAFQARADLASVLVDLDIIEEPCPRCGTLVSPRDLQRVVQHDARGHGR